MKMRLFAALAVVCLAAAAGADEARGEKKGKKAKEPTLLMPADMKWMTPPGAPPGFTLTPLWGDAMKGAHGALVKWPAGDKAETLHIHSGEVRAFVVSGTFLYGADKASVKEFPAGSFIAIPGGAAHVTGCKDGAECLMLQMGDQKFDNIPLGPDGKPMKDKKKEGKKDEEKEGKK